MFTDRTQGVIDRAKDYAFTRGSDTLDWRGLLTAIVQQVQAGMLLAEGVGLEVDTLRSAFPDLPGVEACPGRLRLQDSVRGMLSEAKELAQEVPDYNHPGLINLSHLICAVAMSNEACAILQATALMRAEALTRLTSWSEKEIKSSNINELTARLRLIRSELLSKVFGQDHATHSFVEGLFNAEVVASADDKRRQPRALFVFAGPPGVGKTYLAELGAACLKRPFRRFDMSAYSGHQQNEQLVGTSRSYMGAHPGTLTEFVEKNPDGVLLFDEIEKAHLNTIQLFLQILDVGLLEDKYFERNISFKDTTIIFTTNAGRKLYDRPNESGVLAANATFHRRTILDALENEKDPRTGQPFFPPAICSRIATGYPVLFNYLRINELIKVTQAALERVGVLLERQFYKRVHFHEWLPISLVLREGLQADARTLRSQAENFVKTEMFKFSQLFKNDRLDDVFEHIEHINFIVDIDDLQTEAEIRTLFEPHERSRILLIAGSDLSDLYLQHCPGVDWRVANTAEDALQILANEDVEMILLDLWIGRSTETVTLSGQIFDHIPAASRSLDQGQELLRKVRERVPSVPLFLLSLVEGDITGDFSGTVDEELFMACVSGGGARGMLESSFQDTGEVGWEAKRDQFIERLTEISRRLYREKSASRLGQERKVLAFDTAPRVNPNQREIDIRLRSLRLTRAIAAADAGEILEDIERPRTRFDAVIGADAAKEELQFFIQYLKNPRRFAALGLKPPKGVLLYGPPGTGKTMLARAMAGESNVAFIPVSAANFVTVWQGSGPQSVREIFQRARRYAPAIIFIDEIDAIGRVRSGRAGGGQAEENTLDTLLTELDGFASPSLERPVFVLAATNYRIDGEDQSAVGASSPTLDPALVRRFSRAILVDLPERAAREKYLRLRLEGRRACSVSESAIKLIAERSSGMSIANLESIIEAAARQAVKTEGELTDQLMESAFERICYGEARTRDPETTQRTARHEAGHVLLYWLSGWIPAYVTIVSRGQHGGYMAPAAVEVERRHNRTLGALLADIRVALGGRAAEIHYYGPEAGLSTGASQDLEYATNVARSLICRYGMNEDFGLIVTPELFKFEGALSSPMYLKVNDAANKILKEQMELVFQRLRDNHERLEAVAQALISKERLAAEELKAIFPEPTATDN
ncbi:MAG: AAA family ATPase [Calditrichota bacterium]